MAGFDASPEVAAAFARAPDGLQRLWTPHRLAYVGGDDKPADRSEAECPFCSARTKPDDQGLVVYRGDTCFVVMNLYPYNTGHVLVCPYRHVPRYTDLTEPERAEFGELSAAAMRVLAEVLSPDGFNLGMNQGDVAGAGIAAHLHQHVIPRWLGDSNFFPLIAQTKAVPELLEDTRRRLSESWEATERDGDAG